MRLRVVTHVGLLAFAAGASLVAACGGSEPSVGVTSAGGGGSSDGALSSSSTAASSVTSSSGAGGAPPVTLVSASVIAPDELSLVFSEAMAPPHEVDARVFRLVAATTIAVGTTVFFDCTPYVPEDVDGFVDPPPPGPPPPSCFGPLLSCPGTDVCVSEVTSTGYTTYGYQGGYNGYQFKSLAAGVSDHELIATLHKPLTAAPTFACGELFLAYAAGTPGVRDIAGAELGDIDRDVALRQRGTTAGLLAGDPAPVARGALASFCSEVPCGDGIVDSDESDVDCGGSCPGCAPGRFCRTYADCASMVCAAFTCVDTTCNDGVAHQGCGGPAHCPRCADGAVYVARGRRLLPPAACARLPVHPGRLRWTSPRTRRRDGDRLRRVVRRLPRRGVRRRLGLRVGRVRRAHVRTSVRRVGGRRWVALVCGDQRRRAVVLG